MYLEVLTRVSLLALPKGIDPIETDKPVAPL